jgi:hypothetical protein
MAKLSISKAWEESQRVLAHDGRLLASVALALVLLPEVIASVIAPASSLSGQQSPPWLPLVSIIVLILGVIGQIAIIRLALGPTTSVGQAISHGVRRFVPGLVAAILFIVPLLVLMGLLLGLLAGPTAIAAVRNGTVDPSVGRLFLLLSLAFVLIMARFLLIMPVTTAEPGGPIHILRRAWELGSGHYLRLLGFFVSLLIAAAILLLAAQFLGGILARTLFGDAKPLSVGALLIAVIGGVTQTAFVVVFATLLARIYAQLAGGSAQSGVPRAGI